MANEGRIEPARRRVLSVKKTPAPASLGPVQGTPQVQKATAAWHESTAAHAVGRAVALLVAAAFLWRLGIGFAGWRRPQSSGSS